MRYRPDRSADGGFAILPSTPLTNSHLNRRSVNAGVIQTELAQPFIKTTAVICMADDKTKLDGQRKAVREHIAKYKKYTQQHEKDFALKTIRNAQAQIAKILKRHPHWASSSEDSWSP